MQRQRWEGREGSQLINQPCTKALYKTQPNKKKQPLKSLYQTDLTKTGVKKPSTKTALTETGIKTPLTKTAFKSP